MHATFMVGKHARGQHGNSDSSTRFRAAWDVFALFMLAALLHVGTVVIVHLYSGGQPLFPDARRYDSASTWMAMGWLNGNPPDTDELQRLAGSAFWGYPAVMALAKVVTGGGWLAAKVALSLLAATGAIAAYGLAIASRCGHKRAVMVGLIVGSSPTLLLWDAWGLKDGLITSFVLWSMFLLVRARFTPACLTTLVSIQACLYLRAAAAVFLAVALLTRLRFRRERFVGLFVITMVFAFIVVPRVTTLFGLVDGLEVGQGTSMGFTGGYGSKNLLDHPQYLLNFIFGPYPWAYGPGTAVPERWLYLGTTMWIAFLALAPTALKKAWTDTSGIGRTMILASSAYAVTYLSSFGAEFYRQRSLLECMMIILIVLYLPLSPAAAVSRLLVWLAVVAGLAVTQSSYLTPTAWSKGLAVCLMGLVALFASGCRGWTRRERAGGAGPQRPGTARPTARRSAVPARSEQRQSR